MGNSAIGRGTAIEDYKVKASSGGTPDFLDGIVDGSTIQVVGNQLVGSGGTVVQVVNLSDGAVATGTTVIPNDDTIPQNTEGVEFMTLAVTPTSATNKLKIEVVVHFASSTWGEMAAALFQDTTADALAVGSHRTTVAGDWIQLTFTHYMTSGTTSATTFKVRAGCAGAGTTTFNGQASARRYGGALASSITITEIAV